jgi:hypothetical protein
VAAPPVAGCASFEAESAELAAFALAFELFPLDLAEVSAVRLGEAGDRPAIQTWRPGRLVVRTERT